MSAFRFASPALDPQQLAAEIELALRDVLTLCSPCAVILFGSAARGEAREDSDIDLCLILENSADARSARRRLYARSPVQVRGIDYVLWSREEAEQRLQTGGLVEILRDEGCVLFQKQGYSLPWQGMQSHGQVEEK